MFDFDNRFYRPLWLRVLIVGVCIGWGIVEVTTGSPGFAILFAAMGGYAAYRFFVTFAPTTSDVSKD